MIRSVAMAIAVVMLVSVPRSQAMAQRPQDAANIPTYASYQRALSVLDSAIAAHGGEQRLRAIADMSIRYRGRRWMPYQSPTLTRPWNVQRTQTDLVLDLKNRRMMRYGVSRYPVDFEFHGKTVVTPQGNFFYDPTRAGRGDAFVRFTGGTPVGPTHPARRELPGFVLLNARDRAHTLRHLGTASVEGAAAQVIVYAEPEGTITLYIDNATKRLARVETLRDDPVVGDQVVSTTFSNWRDENGVLVHGRVVERRNAEIIRDDTVFVALNTSPADSLFATPTTGFAEAQDGQQSGPESEAVRKLAENVYLLQQLPGGNRVMFVAFKDHVLVFEAPTPQAAATAAMEAIRRTVPGKPIRYVTFSHHHDDHGGGLRPYIAEGVTIVTTPKNVAFVQEVANARHTIRPDALSSSPKAPTIETFTRKRVFTDGEMTVELHDIGPTSHVDEIVFAYLPKEKLIFQGDLLILPTRGEPMPANTLTREFLRAVDRLRLDVTTIAGVHGPVGTIEDLRKAVQTR